MRLVTIMFLTFSSALHLPGQETVIVSEAQLIQKGIESNIDILRLKQEVRSAKGAYKTTKEMSLPDIGVAYTAMSTNQPLSAFGTKLNQGKINPFDFDPDLLNNPDHIEDFFGKLELQHRFYNPELKYFKKAAYAKLEATGFQLDRKKAHISMEIRISFLDLQLAYKSLDVLNTALKYAGANVKMARDIFREGYIQRSDLLAAELRQRTIENQIILAESSIENISDNISILINDQPGIKYQPGDSLEQVKGSTEGFKLNEDRSDFKAMQKVSEAYASQVEAYKKSSFPRIMAFANYEIHDDGPFAANGNGYMIGLGVHWNILGKKKQEGRISQIKAEYEHSRLRHEQYMMQNRLDLERMKRVLEDSRKNIELTDLSVQQSDEVLRIRTNRFIEGLEKATDLLAAEADLAEKKMMYYKAVYQYNQALVYLEFLTKD